MAGSPFWGGLRRSRPAGWLPFCGAAVLQGRGEERGEAGWSGGWRLDLTITISLVVNNAF